MDYKADNNLPYKQRNAAFQLDIFDIPLFEMFS